VRILSVADVTAYLKDLIELDPILNDVWIRGEVSNFSRSSAGHMYFSLVHEGVQLNCVLFRGNQFGLLATPRSGEAVLAHGRVAIYESRGQYQLIVDNVAPEGIGILQLQFEELQRRLEAEGLFATERKRALPRLPGCIGVVTSAQGAVWHDIQTVIANRFPLVELLLAPAVVQGLDAPDSLIDGLRRLQDCGRCDVIIIGRGGGSAEDLACFNDERLARAIYACKVPVVSAVGHQTDTCIADLVADVRAPTPSVAAALCVPDGAELVAAAGQLVARARAQAVQAARESRESLVLALAASARVSPRGRIERSRLDVDGHLQAARARIERIITEHRASIVAAAGRAALLDPRDILRRGYAIIATGEDPQSVRVTSARQAAAESRLNVTFSDGSVMTQVIGHKHG
jgi:exodeoxyribonuclease VII large subunit